MKYSDIQIDWCSEILADIGYGIQARRILKPLIEGGANVKIIPNEDYIPEERRIKDPYWLKMIEESKGKPDSPLRVNFSIPTMYRPSIGKINVGYTMWETTQYPREWATLINKMEHMFVGSQALVASAKAANITVPIHVVTSTMDVKEWTIEGPSSTVSEVPPDCVKFLFVGNWIPRKNYDDLITGFIAAFDGMKDVALIIKTWPGGPGIEHRKHIEDGIRHLAGKTTGVQRPKINLLMDVIPEEQVISLMRGSDVYVSVAHGEGFDLPMVQAMAVGKPIVSTRFLGHSDYLNDGNSFDVKYTLTPVTGAAAPLYDGYQMWSRPDMQSYINSLREAYKAVKRGSAKAMGLAGRADVCRLFDVETNTERIAALLREIVNGSQTAKVSAKPLVAGLIS